MPATQDAVEEEQVVYFEKLLVDFGQKELPEMNDIGVLEAYDKAIQSVKSLRTSFNRSRWQRLTPAINDTLLALRTQAHRDTSELWLLYLRAVAQSAPNNSPAARHIVDTHVPSATNGPVALRLHLDSSSLGSLSEVSVPSHPDHSENRVSAAIGDASGLQTLATAEQAFQTPTSTTIQETSTFRTSAAAPGFPHFPLFGITQNLSALQSAATASSTSGSHKFAATPDFSGPHTGGSATGLNWDCQSVGTANFHDPQASMSTQSSMAQQDAATAPTLSIPQASIATSEVPIRERSKYLGIPAHAPTSSWIQEPDVTAVLGAFRSTTILGQQSDQGASTKHQPHVGSHAAGLQVMNPQAASSDAAGAAGAASVPKPHDETTSSNSRARQSVSAAANNSFLQAFATSQNPPSHASSSADSRSYQ